MKQVLLTQESFNKICREVAEKISSRDIAKTGQLTIGFITLANSIDFSEELEKELFGMEEK